MIYNILIVDDIAINRTLMKGVLKSFVKDLSFYEASDGFEALDILKGQDIDLVILDLMMPVMDGYEVLEKIKSEPALRDIPVIVNSAISDMDSIKRTLELGAIDYFTKPVTPEQMKVIIPLKTENALKYYEQRKLLKDMNERMKNELGIAATLQQSMMGKNTEKDFDKIKVHGQYHPCSALGGDFYDFAIRPEGVWFIIADITNHGVAAALVSSMVKAVFHQSINNVETPREVLKEINLTFCNMELDCMYLSFSAFVGLIKDQKLLFSNGGHPYPLLLREEPPEVSFLEGNGFLIGIFPDVEYDQEEMCLQEGDMIFTYTDGLYDLPRKNGMCGDYTEVLSAAQSLYANGTRDLEGFANLMMEYFDKTGQATVDDVAIMGIKIME